MLIRLLLSIIPLMPILSPITSLSGETISAAGTQKFEDCRIILEPLISGDITSEQLSNPILTSQSEIDARLDLFSDMYSCLEDDANLLTGEEGERIRALLEYFLIFAGGLDTPSDETTLELVMLENSTDPAIIEIRDEAGIEPPEGFIFLRFYSSREAMPQLLRRAFISPEVAGVTIFSRYIAVLAEDKKTWPQRALQLQTLPETTSHELIHAFVNSTLAPMKVNLPAWYSEGLAIYFSGSEGIHTIVTPNLTITNSSSEDYRQYDTTLKYLESRHGRERLLELINSSIKESDPTILYRDLEINDDQQLLSQARAWSQGRNNLARGGIVVVALIAVLLLWRLAPEYNCQNCGHTGKKRDLIDELYCPNCNRPYDREVPW